MRRALLALLGSMTACSQASNGSDGNCPQGGSLEVTVVDTASNDPICDATVTLTPSAGGAAQPVPATAQNTPSCHYYAQVSAGRYALTASKGGYQTSSVGLNVTTDGCTIDSPSVTLDLTTTM